MGDWNQQQFFGQKEFVSLEGEQEGKVPRDRWDRPLIIPPDGGRPQPYARASSFGGVLEDKSNLEKWGKRQMIRGVAIDPSIIDRVPDGPARERGGELTKRDKDALNRLADAADEAVGSNDKAKICTAIHYATEVADLGGDLSELTPFLRERADAYWKFCRAWGLTMTSVETFGVEDQHKVAGTWDRIGFVPWDRDVQRIFDVKTSSTMQYAGIGFSVQLGEYAHMFAYDPETGGRTPHETMHLEEAFIIHVGREQGSPVEMYRVDIAMGWRHASLVAAVRAARREGGKAISAVDEIEGTILSARSVEELGEEFAMNGGSWTSKHKGLATTVAARLRGEGR